jgi:copper chaperone CopZ/uncharacterized membrane protein YeaQ/YmgE (transglycosylase-associated protein family)
MSEEEKKEKTNLREEPSCCIKKNKKESKGFLSGLLYGLLPHTGCIAFILFSIFGITAATAIFKPLLMSRYFFYGLIALSFVFATISAAIYLKRCNMLSKEGIKKKWKYLSILYGTSILVNIILFMVIFPIAANITSAGQTTPGDSKITLEVDIPCSGHAPLITEELKTIGGVNSVNFRFPNYFDVSYDSSKTSQEQILALKVFQEYPATKIQLANELASPPKTQSTSTKQGCGGSCGGCSGSCGGSCGAKQ